MNKLISSKLYHPVLYFFLLALLSLLFGSVLALQYGEFNLLAITFFYLYILVNQLIENILLRISNKDFQLSKKFIFILEIINLTIILFFIRYYSLNSGFILILYTLTIQLQFLFSYYNLERTASLISSFLKVILLNGFAFYIHTHFINYNYFLYYFGIYFPYLIYELARINNKNKDKLVTALTILSYTVAFIVLWKKISYLSLFLLLTIPIHWLGKEEINRKNSAVFLINFSIFYLILLVISFIS